MSLTPSAIKSLLFVSVLSLAGAASLHADTIELKNGDKLTGTAVKLDGGKLTFKTDYAADPIAISWDQVTSLTTSKPLVLTTAKGNVNVTGIERSGTNLEVKGESGSSTIAAADVQVIRTPADQATYEASLHPSWTHAWAGAANVSLALARGNSNITTFGAGMTAARTTLHDKTSVYVNTLYSTNGKATPSTSANATGGGLRYDHNLNPKIFAYGSGDFYTDALQELDLRSILGGGAGWHAIKKPNEGLDVLGGIVWTHESYSSTVSAPATTNSFPALDLSEQYSRKFGAGSLLTEQFSFYPDLKTTSNYQFALNTTFSTKLKKNFNWTTSFTDNYTSFPPSGTLNNDVILTTGLGITLARP